MNKQADEWDKPRTFRDRKTKKKDEPRDHPLHEPYYREHKNWTKEAQDAEDIFREDEIPDGDGCLDGTCDADQ